MNLQFNVGAIPVAIALFLLATWVWKARLRLVERTDRIRGRIRSIEERRSAVRLFWIFSVFYVALAFVALFGRF